MTLAAWFHDVDPIIFRIAGDFAVRWYGVAYALGFLLGWLQLDWLAKRGASLLHPARIPDAMMAMIFGVVLGGRLGYVLVYQPELMWTVEKSFPFWGTLMINKGGMAFHGALTGLLVAAWFIASGARAPGGTRANSIPFLHMMDLIAFVAPAGLMLGRVANFVNGELLGQIVAKPGEPAPWWTVKFPQEIGSGHAVPYTPEQARELGAVLDRFGRSTVGESHAVDQLLREVHHGHGATHDSLLGELATLVSARHPSQLYQAFAEGPILGLVLWIVWARPKRPGVIGCTFLIMYGILRVIIEQFFRLPDAPLGKVWGLSRGQWLSGAMVVGGVVILAMIATVLRRRGVYGNVLVGGWLTKRTA